MVEKEKIKENYRKVVLAMCIILTMIAFYYSVIPGVTLVESEESYSIQNSGSLMHGLAYFVLTVSYFAYFYFTKGVSGVWFSGIFVSAYSTFVEIVQYFIPYRAFEFADIGFNLLVIGLTVVGLFFLFKMRGVLLRPVKF